MNHHQPRVTKYIILLREVLEHGKVLEHDKEFLGQLPILFLSVGQWDNQKIHLSKSSLPGTKAVLKTYSIEDVMEIFVSQSSTLILLQTQYIILSLEWRVGMGKKKVGRRYEL